MSSSISCYLLQINHNNYSLIFNSGLKDKQINVEICHCRSDKKNKVQNITNQNKSVAGCDFWMSPND